MAACNACASTEATLLYTLHGFQLVKCSGCGLAYIANQPDEVYLSALYSADGGDYHTELHDPASPAAERMLRIAETHLRFLSKVARGGRLIDIGCSTGSFLKRASRAGFDCSGVEFSKSSARVARGQTGLPVEVGGIHDSTCPPGTLDVLTMFDVIEHVTNPMDDLARAYAMLRPGGWLVLSTPNIDGLFPRASYPLARIVNHWPHPEAPYHLYQFSVATLSAMLRKAGFEPGPVEHHNIDLAYSFGTLGSLARSPKRLAYAAAFAPLAKLGPLIGQGDWFYIAAQKPAEPATLAIAA
ncbi:MAG: class I SAM-dependent methyltransferase [Proteobacteria bacterium]|nr:class I SAM-dependent methyltransferase [Pseudomonadota bacterium]